MWKGGNPCGSSSGKMLETIMSDGIECLLHQKEWQYKWLY